MTARSRILAILTAVLVLGGVAVGYLLSAAGRDARGGGATGTVSLAPVAAASGGSLIVRSTADGPNHGHLAELSAADPSGPRTLSAAECVRVYAAGGTGVCLRPSQEAPGQYEISVLDSAGRSTRAIPMTGVPSRARVSPSGRMVAWTVFVSGDSYNGGRFSTRAGILDTRANVIVGTLERFAVTLDGQPYQNADLNFWGVTFTRDDNTFYATMATQGRRYLVQGDLAAKTVRTLRENVECPSLSPDGTRIVFKKRVSEDPSSMWRLSVLDLATMRETPLAETRSVDDQGAWLDDRTVMYGLPRDAEHSDVWRVPADGSGAPAVLVPDAESPSTVS